MAEQSNPQEPNPPGANPPGSNSSGSNPPGQNPPEPQWRQSEVPPLQPNASYGAPPPSSPPPPSPPLPDPRGTAGTPNPQPTQWPQPGMGVETPPGSVNCPNCGRPVVGAGAFCPYCGAAMGTARRGSGISVWRILLIIFLTLVALFAGAVGACFVILGGIAASTGTVEPTLAGTAVVSIVITLLAIVGIYLLARRR